MHPARSRLVGVLRRRLARQAGRPLDNDPVSTGVPALDRLLPRGGFTPGSLVEYLGLGVSLALAAARSTCQDRPLLVVDPLRQLHAAAWGIELSRTVVVRPASAADELWACDQALRCPGVGAVLARLERLQQRDFRRLQLAAESGGTFGLLIRPARLRGQPTWADVQWLVQPCPSPGGWRLQVELLRCRGGTGGGSAVLELDDTLNWREAKYANPVHSSAELAHPAAARRRSGA
jgi:hypothetical protein